MGYDNRSSYHNRQRLVTNNVSPYGALAGGCNGDWFGDRHISDNLKYTRTNNYFFAKSVWSSWGVLILFAVDAAHDDLLYCKFTGKSNKILSIKVYMEYLISFVNDLPFFMAVFFRIGGMLFFAPIFGNAHIPMPVRIAIALMFTFILYPGINKNQSMLPSDIISYSFIVLKEIAIGAVVGFAASMIFAAFNMAGNLISNQMGLDTAMVVDPSSQTGDEESVISVFYNMIAILIFLLINGHHWFIKTTAQSFTMIPLGSFDYTTITLTKILAIFKSLFLMGIKISAPALLVLLLSVVALGLMTKVAQEINVFIIAFPIKICIGFFILMVSIPFVINVMKSYMLNFEKSMISLLSTM